MSMDMSAGQNGGECTVALLHLGGSERLRLDEASEKLLSSRNRTINTQRLHVCSRREGGVTQ